LEFLLTPTMDPGECPLPGVWWRQKYRLAQLEFAAVAPGAALHGYEVLRHALIGPIPKFFTPFHGTQGEPIPDTVSRHATVHKPTVKHFSRVNALTAIMLSTSILREQQAWCEEVRASDADNKVD
jgi:hypothetical protein